MKIEAIESSVIAHMGYDAERRLLRIEFRRTGHVYDYFEVPPEEYREFRQAESKGRYLNQVFKPHNYRSLRVL